MHGLATLPRVHDEDASFSAHPLESVPQQLERIAVRHNGGTVLLHTAELDWCESAGNYVKLHAGKVTRVMRSTLSSLERRLDSAAFVRIHRRLIVNIERIAELKPWLAGDQIVILKDGSRLRLSRTFRARVAHRLASRTSER
jgi:two-component system LytT family response regulator